MIVVTVILIGVSILIALFVCCRCRQTRKESYTNGKIVHLVLFSDKSPYKDMMQITRDLYRSVPDVTTIYYCYDPSLHKPYDYNPSAMTLHIRGNETYTPGILLKTLDAIQFVLNQFPKAELIVRSNASTVLDLRKMCQECVNDPTLTYGGCWVNKLAWLDPPGGVKDKRWWGTRYASGTCILMRRSFAEQLVKDRSKIRSDLVDDLSIGVWTREHAVNVKVWESPTGGKDWFFRNRQANRQNDLVRMRQLVQQLSR